MKQRPEFPHKGCGIRGAKKERHRRKGSGTSGHTKTKSCQATWFHRFACRVSRAYRDPLYNTIWATIHRKAL